VAISETIKLKDSISSSHSNKWVLKELAVFLDKLKLNKTQLEEDLLASLVDSQILLGFNLRLLIL
jgi:hypothetical protein